MILGRDLAFDIISCAYEQVFFGLKKSPPQGANYSEQKNNSSFYKIIFYRMEVSLVKDTFKNLK